MCLPLIKHYSMISRRIILVDLVFGKNNNGNIAFSSSQYKCYCIFLDFTLVPYCIWSFMFTEEQQLMLEHTTLGHFQIWTRKLFLQEKNTALLPNMLLLWPITLLPVNYSIRKFCERYLVFRFYPIFLASRQFTKNSCFSHANPQYRCL
jgi:hypothetical protein